mgnify:CR=1 FL=1
MDTRLRQARQHFEAGDFVAARDLSKLVLGSDGSCADAWYLSGQCYRYLDDYRSASADLTRALMLDPGNKHICLALGIAEQLQENWSAALAALKAALDIDPIYAAAFNSLALTQKKNGGVRQSTAQLSGRQPGACSNDCLKNE